MPPSAPAVLELDFNDMTMHDYPMTDTEHANLGATMEALRLQTTEVEVPYDDSPIGELRALKLKLLNCSRLHRELKLRYQSIPQRVREHPSVPLAHQSSCSTAFGDEAGESVSDVVLECIESLLRAAEVAIAEAVVELAVDHMQIADGLLDGVSGTLKRFEEGVVVHEMVARAL